MKIRTNSAVFANFPDFQNISAKLILDCLRSLETDFNSISRGVRSKKIV